MSISSFSGPNDDVCYPLQVQGTLGYSQQQVPLRPGFQIDEDWIKPYALDDVGSRIGMADWFISQLDDRSAVNTIKFLRSQNAFVNRNTIETGVDKVFPILDFTGKVSNVAPLTCQNLFTLGLTKSEDCGSPDEFIYLNDETLIGGKSWKQWKSEPTYALAIENGVQ